MVGRVTPNSAAIWPTVQRRLPCSAYICRVSATCRGPSLGFWPPVRPWHERRQARRGCVRIVAVAFEVGDEICWWDDGHGRGGEPDDPTAQWFTGTVDSVCRHPAAPASCPHSTHRGRTRSRCGSPSSLLGRSERKLGSGGHSVPRYARAASTRRPTSSPVTASRALNPATASSPYFKLLRVERCCAGSVDGCTAMVRDRTKPGRRRPMRRYRSTHQTIGRWSVSLAVELFSFMPQTVVYRFLHVSVLLVRALSVGFGGACSRRLGDCCSR
ncbi:hypothetical protein DFR71_6250 [Nocardia alba]|uniref:Uncharacterized protein n=1 Tax=Nocardia alba TaxID=225051 RepID=A0A4R1F8N6_9NOCA|nr:hypothetical protein DFR71_6250 [Nocardia alba]